MRLAFVGHRTNELTLCRACGGRVNLEGLCVYVCVCVCVCVLSANRTGIPRFSKVGRQTQRYCASLTRKGTSAVTVNGVSALVFVMGNDLTVSSNKICVRYTNLDEVRVKTLIIVSFKGWNSSNICEQP